MTINNRNPPPSSTYPLLLFHLNTLFAAIADKDGWLEKMGEYSAEYKKRLGVRDAPTDNLPPFSLPPQPLSPVNHCNNRWCVLKLRHLNYFDNQQDKNPTNVTPKGLILLDDSSMFRVVSESDFVFELITPNRTYKFRALSENDFNEWKTALTKVETLFPICPLTGPLDLQFGNP